MTYLDPDDAFQINYDSQPGQFKASWVIAEGHYLYRDKVQITTDEAGINSKPGDRHPAKPKMIRSSTDTSCVPQFRRCHTALHI